MKANIDTKAKSARGFGELFAKVRRTVAAHALLEPEAPVVLMVSGGSDSVALTTMLTTLYPSNPYVVLHINHGLRGDAADADEKFVATLAQKLGLAFHAVRLDVAALAASTGGNIEQLGRELRYHHANNVLDALCAEKGADPSVGRIAVAHTLDDRVETFYMRSIVGGGAGSLSSIPYVNGRVVRPLLDCTRAELRAYLLDGSDRENSRETEGAKGAGGASETEEGGGAAGPSHALSQPWREDATNYDTEHLRAFVRHELMPLAQARNPELLATLRRSIDILAGEDAYLDTLVDELETRFVAAGEGESLRVDGTVFSAAKPLVRRLLHRLCGRVLPHGERITFGHIENITKNGQLVGFVTNLPGDVLVRNVYGTLVIQRNSQRIKELRKQEFCLVLEFGVPCMLPMGGRVELFSVPAAAFADKPVDYALQQATPQLVFVDGAALGVTETAPASASVAAAVELRVSNLQEGERFCPLGMQGRHKLVSDVLIDRKMPLEARAKQPVVRANGRIVW
ncbi:MAG: tRNA lysidine(34) synthetase TilS, partial [Coriobacteriales bacterium]|nr:tRNA lysidine(34) synthetase TilS [Coriobacteriales bacterium]